MKLTFKISFLLTFSIFSEECYRANCEPHVILRNNGPAVIGAKITFTAIVVDYFLKSELTYIFDDGIQKTEYSSSSLNMSITKAFPPDLYSEGSYRMNVTIKIPIIIFKETVAENHTRFELRRFLIGEIHVYQGNTTVRKDVDAVSVNENFTAVIDLYDPNQYLKDAVIDYGWSIDMTDYITLNNSFIYNFSSVGEKYILAKSTATLPDSTSIFGYFKKELTAKVPVNNISISGNTFLHHGDFLMLNVSCSGTPPFEYCSKILKDNVTVENFTCSQISMFTNCHMEIKKFLTDGKYCMGIYIGNEVKEVKRVLEIIVSNVTIKPTLSTVIIPIVCSLLTLIIIIIGISYYIQQRNQLAVEVANFDFQEESDSYSGERTFFEKIFDSFICRSCRYNKWHYCFGNRSESDPLITDESLPYV